MELNTTLNAVSQALPYLSRKHAHRIMDYIENGIGASPCIAESVVEFVDIISKVTPSPAALKPTAVPVTASAFDALLHECGYNYVSLYIQMLNNGMYLCEPASLGARPGDADRPFIHECVAYLVETQVIYNEDDVIDYCGYYTAPDKLESGWSLYGQKNALIRSRAQFTAMIFTGLLDSFYDDRDICEHSKISFKTYPAELGLFRSKRSSLSYRDFRRIVAFYRTCGYVPPINATTWHNYFVSHYDVTPSAECYDRISYIK